MRHILGGVQSFAENREGVFGNRNVMEFFIISKRVSVLYQILMYIFVMN